jgi:hypothetical protein
MQVFKIGVKIFAAEGFSSPHAFVPIFQRWIQNQSVPGHRLIDVADYAHVSGGPGTVLVSSEANFHMDLGENRLGLLYFRKLPIEGSFADRVRAVVVEALRAAAKLEQEPELAGKLKFRTDELLIRLYDRLLAPPTQQTVAACEGDMRAIAKALYPGTTSSLESSTSPMVEFRLKSTAGTSLAALLERLGG